MKNLTLRAALNCVQMTVLILLSSLNSMATTYFSGSATGDPTLVTSWWTGTGGTGSNPANFTSGDTFIIQSGHNYTIPNGTTWTVNAITGGTAATIQINGILTFMLTNSSSVLSLGGNLNPAASTSIAGNGTSSTGSIVFTSNGTWTGSGDVSGCKTKITVNSGVTLDVSGSSGLKLKSSNTIGITVNGTLIMGTVTINGNGNTSATFSLGTSGTLVTATTSANGLPGIFTGFSAGKINLTNTASYVFNGLAAQVTGTTANNATMPGAVKSLTFNNSAGVTLSQATTVTNLTLTAGKVSGNLTLGSGGTITGGSSTAYWVGQLTVPFTAPILASFTFPVGTASAYSPVSVTNFTDTGSGSLTASATAAQDPNQGSSSIDNTKYIARYWTLAGSGFNSPTYDFTGTFVGSDIQNGANTANLVVEKWDGTGWSSPVSSSSTNTTVTGAGFTNTFGQFAAGETATTPVVSSTTKSAITNTSATLGATVLSASGSIITDFGIVWGTSPNPTITGNKIQAGTTVTPPNTFTVNAMALPAATTIYYRGYAASAIGTGYSTNDSFATISYAPSIQASGANFSGVQGGAMTISWTRGNGANCIVVVSASSPVNSNPVYGTTYTANTTFGGGSQIGTGNYVVYLGTGNSVTFTALAPNTTYYVAVYELNGSGGSENYQTTSPAIGSQTSLSHPVTYYSNASATDPTLLTSWTTGADGTGANPNDFNSGDTFIIQSGNNYTLASGAIWTVNAATAGTAATVQINSGGALTFTLGTGSASPYLKLGGNLNQAAAGGIAGNGTSNAGYIEFTSNGSWTGSGDISATKVFVTVDSGVTLDASGMNAGFKLKNGNTVGIIVNGTLNAGTLAISGNGGSSASFTLGSSGTLITASANASGLPGIFTGFSAGKITLPATANYIFNGSAAQVTGTTANNATMPTTVNILTISNSAGVTLSQATIVGGMLTVNTNSILDLNSMMLTVSNQPALNGKLAMEVGKSGGTVTNSQLILINGALGFSGALSVTTNGSPLAIGDTFQLFSSSGYSNSFSSIVLPTSYVWDTSQLAVNGTIQVVPGINVFLMAYDDGPGFFSGEDLLLTNASGVNLCVWSSPDPSVSVSNWTLEGKMSEQVYNNNSGKSLYSINVTPAVSPVYYIFSRTNIGPYAATEPVVWLTTSDFVSFALSNAIVPISTNGILLFPALPVITQQPQNASVLAGQNSGFSVATTGTGLGYQWYFNSNGLAGAAAPSLGLPNVTGVNAGGYFVIITNSLGSATSSVATLAVTAPPLLSFQTGISGIQLNASSITGLTYVVQTTTNLAAPVWQPILTNNTGNGGTVNFQTNAPSVLSQFYRLAFP